MCKDSGNDIAHLDIKSCDPIFFSHNLSKTNKQTLYSQYLSTIHESPVIATLNISLNFR